MKTMVCIASPHPSSACQSALAMARRLGDGVSVTVLSAGHEPETSVFHEGGCAGFSRMVYLCDPTLATADAYVLGTILAESARLLEAELILAGTASDEEGRGLVPAMLAQHLGANILSDVEDVCFDGAEAQEITAVRCAGGQRLRLSFKFPVVLTVAPAALPLGETQPIHGDLPAVERLTLAQLGIDPNQLLPLPNVLGSLETGRPKPEVLPSLDALVARWLGKT